MVQEGQGPADRQPYPRVYRGILEGQGQTGMEPLPGYLLMINASAGFSHCSQPGFLSPGCLLNFSFYWDTSYEKQTIVSAGAFWSDWLHIVAPPWCVIGDCMMSSRKIGAPECGHEIAYAPNCGYLITCLFPTIYQREGWIHKDLHTITGHIKIFFSSYTVNLICSLFSFVV